jgi:type II secretory pathway predicted ATPase ExeA
LLRVQVRAQGSEPLMSESPFQFQHKPFSSVPDADCFIPLPIHDQALQGLRDWVEQGEGLGMLTGIAGLGKTLLCQRLLSEYADKIQVVLLPHGNFPNAFSFLKAVLFQLNCNYAGLDEDELRLELGSALGELANDNSRLLLMIDGAQDMDESMLQELQVLSQSHSGSVQVLLSGQLELEELMTRRSLSGLSQQVRTHQILESLTRAESADYLAGRVSWAGNDIEAIMTEDAVEMMTHLSDGVPRCLNRIAETAVRIAMNRQSEVVDKDCVREAYEDVRHLPLQWNAWPDETPAIANHENMPHSAENATVSSSRVDAAITKELKPHHFIPDLKSEAEEAGVEYAVAEFGGEEEDSDDRLGETDETMETASPEESVLDLSQNTPQNSLREESLPSVSDSLNAAIDDHVAHEEAFKQDVQDLVEIMESNQLESSHVATSASAESSDLTSTDKGNEYLQSRFNPVDIFANDLPTGAFPADNQVSSPESSTVLLKEVQQIISDEVEKVAEKEVEVAWETNVDEESATHEYDVIEPEAIPDISKVRPTFELDLPHREPQPRYRNLFRDLRRRRG